MLLRRQLASPRSTEHDQDLLLGAGRGPTATHWFGTDELGRDQLTELLYAGQISLKIGFAVAFLSTVVGTVVGAVAGYFGSGTDQVLMRVTDLFLIVPSIAILAVALKKFGQHRHDRSSSCSPVLFWMYVARVVRGQVLSLKEKEFVEAARAVGRVEPRGSSCATSSRTSSGRSW